MRRKRTKILSFDIKNFAEKELVDKFSLWMLRVILKLNTIDELIDKDCFIRQDTLAYFLGLESIINKEDINRDEVIDFLIDKLNKLESRKRFSTNKLLTKNINNLSKIIQLNNYEKDLLEFSILLNQYDILDDCTSFLGCNLNSSQAKRALSIILDIPIKEINQIFSTKSNLVNSSLLTFDSKYTRSLKDKLEFITDIFADSMTNLNGDIETIFKEIIYKCNKSDLVLNDFEYIKSELDILVPYLNKSIQSSKKGVNILLYGVPGTGKTELAKVISGKLNTSLYEISYCDENDEPIEGLKRLRAYKFAQSLLLSQKTFLLFDEVEDVFNSNDIFSKRQNNKAWVNKILENNTIPTIWVTNDVNSIDNAILRRFDISIEMPIPTKTKRKKIFTKYSENILSEELISSLSSNEMIAPALVSRASKVVSILDEIDTDKAFKTIIQNTLKTQGYEFKKEEDKLKLPKSYNPLFINCNTDLTKLSKGIKENPNARLCLYGPAGTGKSAYGKYLANFFNKPLILKKGSDLLGMFVGQTEKNIAKAFEEAKQEDAILVFDEVDSFLQSREYANRNWEVTQVNEMLVQMENFNGIFIATTNLIENLDRASLRRFDLKLEFGFLQEEQSWKLFKSECKNLGFKRVSQSSKEKILSLRFLTPGDFAAVIRQNRFNPIKNTDDFLNRLTSEVEIKSIDTCKTMGFL